jgi:hypothetical protein
MMMSRRDTRFVGYRLPVRALYILLGSRGYYHLGNIMDDQSSDGGLKLISAM